MGMVQTFFALRIWVGLPLKIKKNSIQYSVLIKINQINEFFLFLYYKFNK